LVVVRASRNQFWDKPTSVAVIFIFAFFPLQLNFQASTNVNTYRFHGIYGCATLTLKRQGGFLEGR